MQKDVRLGLILAAAVTFAIGWKRFGPAEGASSPEEAKQGVESKVVLPGTESLPALELPPTSEAPVAPAPKVKPTSPSQGKSNALAPLFPKDFRKAADPKAGKKKESAPALMLPGDLQPAAVEETLTEKNPAKSELSAESEETGGEKPSTSKEEKGSKKSPPPLLALPEDDSLSSSPSRATQGKATKENEPKAESAGQVKSKGPVHPYFQRFLDDGSYFVRDGDSLEEIARNLYQDESMVEEILKRNQKILKKKSELKPGMRLEL